MTSDIKVQIHYYLTNNSHSMDAFVRNKCETELLALYREICLNIGIYTTVESTVFNEGGLKEAWRTYGPDAVQIQAAAAIFVLLLQVPSTWKTIYPPVDPQREAREKSIQELTIEEKQLLIEEKRLIIKKLKEEMKDGTPGDKTIEEAAKAVEQNIKIQSRRSNFYRQLESYSKVSAVSFSAIPLSSEEPVLRSDFKKFILTNNRLPTEKIEEATIEIVSPVLKEGKYKWKGIFNEEIISFSMLDGEFKSSVLGRQQTFQHGNSIKCVLEIHRRFNEVGDIEITGYGVKTVLEKSDGVSQAETPQGKRHRENKKFIENQQGLF